MDAEVTGDFRIGFLTGRIMSETEPLGTESVKTDIILFDSGSIVQSHQTGRDPKISVIVAVFNVEDYLTDCLESLTEQVFQDVEFLVVDDCSTDGCAQLCDSYARKDARFRILHLNENRGALLARKEALDLARGDFILFIDGDDYYPHERVIKIIADVFGSLDADIASFDIGVFGGGEEQEKAVLDWFRIKGEREAFTPLRIMEKCFVKGENSWNLSNKLFRASILKKAYSQVENVHMITATDAYVYFLMAYYSSSFRSVPTEGLYAYRLKSGMTTRRITLENFAHYAKEPLVGYRVKRFLAGQDAPESYLACAESLKEHLLTTVCWRFDALSRIDMPQAFDILADRLPLADLMTVFRQHYQGREEVLAGGLEKDRFPERCGNGHGTIAVYLPDIDAEDLHVTVRSRIRLFCRKGFSVVLFSERSIGQLESELPEDVGFVHMPKPDSPEHFSRLEMALGEYSVDTLVYHFRTGSTDVLFDALMARKRGIRFLGAPHGLVFQNIPVRGGTGIRRRFECILRVAGLFNGLIVQSRLEKAFFSSFDIPAHFIPDLPAGALSHETGGKPYDVIWIGKQGVSDRAFHDAVGIIRRLVEANAALKCLIALMAPCEKHRRFVHDSVSAGSLGENVVVVDVDDDLTDWLGQAKVQLVTLADVSWPVEVMAGRAVALPLVIYDQSQLEFPGDKRGVVPVGHFDIHAVANAILRLLDDVALLTKLSEEARDAWNDICGQYDVGSLWGSVLSGDVDSAPDDRTAICRDYAHLLNAMIGYLPEETDRHSVSLPTEEKPEPAKKAKNRGVMKRIRALIAGFFAG